jgi:hypothetical protein
MAKKRLSEELKATEIPQDSDESLPQAVAVQRRRHTSEPSAAGAEHRSGVVEREEEPQPPGKGRASKDPPRGQPSGR